MAVPAVEDLWRAGRIGQTVAIMTACGIEDAGFRQTITRAVRYNGAGFAGLVKVFLGFAGRKPRIENPGAWIRTALEREGVRL